MRSLAASRIAACVAAVACGCWSTPRPAAPSRVVTIPLQATSFALASGLRVVIARDPGAATVSVTTSYAVGDLDDPPGAEGVAHLVEHLLYEPVRDGVSLYDTLERDALAFNGYTTLDATIYTARGRPAQLGELLEVQATRLEQRCATVPDAAFARQREIVRNELRERARADRVRAVLDQAVFPAGHPLHRATAGTADSVAGITRARACAFADAYYTPASAVTVISGDVTVEEARALVERTLGRIRRAAPARPREIPPLATHRRVTAKAPVDRPLIALAWPLPEDPVRRARIRAFAAMAGALVDARVNGVAHTVELGGARTRAIAIEIEPSSEISISDALDGAQAALRELSRWFASGLFDQARNDALYRLCTTFEPGLARDLELADDARAGRDVAATIAAEVQGLSRLDRGDAAELARTALSFSSATVVTLEPAAAAAGPGAAAGGPAPAIDEHHRHSAEDPAAAHRPAPARDDADPLARVRTRQLANGLRVVLLPLSSIPTVDIRLVFAAGTADEPPGRRGVAMLAAYGLGVPAAAVVDVVRFARAGGDVQSRVGFDDTAFEVRGLSGQLDELLSGLGVVIQEGGYESFREVSARMQLLARATPSELEADLAWRAARFGADHPYAHAGIWQRSDAGAFQLAAVRAFRRAHYQPDRATLIIAGGFDPELADRWIDYAFGEWQGHGIAPVSMPATLEPLAFAEPGPGSQIAVQIALPAAGVDRAAALIATEMLSEAISDVREELAASYGLRATLSESRLATQIVIEGSIDAARASEAFALLRDRLAKLRVPDDDTARLFVSARRRVVARLSWIRTGATSLAERAQDDLALGRSLGAERATAAAAREITIERLAPVLAGLDLSRAVLLMRGPQPAVVAAYAAIGRTPAVLAPPASK